MLSTPATASRAVPAGPACANGAEALAERALVVARRTALGVLGDHAAADDVAQEVAITALRRIGDLREPAALDAWIHRIATRRAIKEAKRMASRRAAELAREPYEGETAGGLGTTEPGDGLDDALALLDGLPARQRAALTLRYVHDLDDAQIAKALRCRTGTVRSLLSRGRDALRANVHRPASGADHDHPGAS